VAVATFLVAICPETNTLHVAQELVPAAVPVCPPQTEDIVYFADSDNCNMFYECSNGVAIHIECPPDLYFCIEKEICDWPNDKECSFNCKVVTSNPLLV
jgi:hypothetical protein